MNLNQENQAMRTTSKQMTMRAMILVTALLASSGAAEPEVFEVSKVTKANRAMFLELFASAQAEAARPVPESIFKVRRKRSDTEFEGYYVPPGTLQADYDQLYIVRLAKAPEHGLADDELVRAKAIPTTKTVESSGRTLRVWVPAPEPQKLTREDFLKRVKAGETFSAIHSSLCQECRGSGRVTPTRGKGEKDGKVRCRSCHGKGKRAVRYTLKW